MPGKVRRRWGWDRKGYELIGMGEGKKRIGHVEDRKE